PTRAPDVPGCRRLSRPHPPNAAAASTVHSGPGTTAARAWPSSLPAPASPSDTAYSPKIYEEARKSMYQTGSVRSCIWKIFGTGNVMLAQWPF
ncbi:hypothetical protein BRADI_3g16522v3, partial [Brachypodium distachyon]